MAEIWYQYGINGIYSKAWECPNSLPRGRLHSTQQLISPVFNCCVIPFSKWLCSRISSLSGQPYVILGILWTIPCWISPLKIRYKEAQTYSGIRWKGKLRFKPPFWTIYFTSSVSYISFYWGSLLILVCTQTSIIRRHTVSQSSSAF